MLEWDSKCAAAPRSHKIRGSSALFIGHRQQRLIYWSQAAVPCLLVTGSSALFTGHRQRRFINKLIGSSTLLTSSSWLFIYKLIGSSTSLTSSSWLFINRLIGSSASLTSFSWLFINKLIGSSTSLTSSSWLFIYKLIGSSTSLTSSSWLSVACSYSPPIGLPNHWTVIGQFLDVHPSGFPSKILKEAEKALKTSDQVKHFFSLLLSLL